MPEGGNIPPGRAAVPEANLVEEIKALVAGIDRAAGALERIAQALEDRAADDALG